MPQENIPNQESQNQGASHQQQSNPQAHSTTQGGNEQQQVVESADNTKLITVLSYIGILFIIPLLMAKENSFAQFHAKQGAALFVAEVVTMLIVWIPFLGWLIGFLAWIVWIILSVMGIINVLNNQKKQLPLIGQLAEKF